MPKSADAWRAAIDQFGKKPTPADILAPPFVQLFDVRRDPGESKNVAVENPDVVKQLVALFQQQVVAGRSTPGKKLENDVPRRNLHRRIPKFVFE